MPTASRHLKLKGRDVLPPGPIMAQPWSAGQSIGIGLAF
jgi:hypothetical protein